MIKKNNVNKDNITLSTTLDDYSMNHWLIKLVFCDQSQLKNHNNHDKAAYIDITEKN